MADNIAPDEVKRRLILFLRIPTEVWTDVLKMIPRRNLVQLISPTCFRLKEIANKNVKCIHVISKAIQKFTDKLNNNDPEANRQLWYLGANKCQLAGQFKLPQLWIGEESKAILRHCLDLLRGCQIFCFPIETDHFLYECLGMIESTKPSAITITPYFFEDNMDPNIWLQPTVQNCSRIRISLSMSDANMLSIFEWLHKPMPVEADCNDGADQQIRCMILKQDESDQFDLLLTRCFENLASRECAAALSRAELSSLQSSTDLMMEHF